MAARASALPFAISLVCWLLCCALVRAQETTTELPTTTTLPDGNQQATVGWVGNPKRRGTVSLIIECLTTIFACTWTALHLNIPAITDSTMTRVLRKAKWMAVTILFPEFIFAKAVCELQFALEMLDWAYVSIETRPGDFQTVSEVKANGRSAWVLWAWTVEFEPLKRFLYRLLMWETSTNQSHARLDASRRRASSVPPSTVSESEENLVKKGRTFIEKNFLESDQHFDGSAIARMQKWTLTHAYYANMGGIVARRRMNELPSDNKESFFTHSYSIIPGDHLAVHDLRAWKLGHPLKELRLSAEDIQDKSKADWIAKILAVFQIVRLIFDLITRGVGAQPVTQLEIATASFSVFAVVTYLANWWKPKDVSQPTRIDAVVDEGMRGDPVERITEQFFARVWSPRPPAHRYEDTISADYRIRNDELWIGRGRKSGVIWVLMATSCLIFGGIHCIAWSFPFPTQAEEFAWRIAAMVSAALPVITLVGSFLILRYRSRALRRKRDKAAQKTVDFYRRALKNFSKLWWHTFLTAVSTPEWDEWVKSRSEQSMTGDMERLRWELAQLAQLRDSVLDLETATRSSDREEHFTTAWNIAHRLRDSQRQESALRDQYETWVRDTHAFLNYPDIAGRYPYGVREGTFLQWFFTDCLCAQKPARVQAYLEAEKNWDIHAQRLLRVLNISSGIIYTAARLVLLAIMFTSLRSVPDGVYDTANWTRFVPTIS